MKHEDQRYWELRNAFKEPGIGTTTVNNSEKSPERPFFICNATPVPLKKFFDLFQQASSQKKTTPRGVVHFEQAGLSFQH
jgi:hypothetical protein